MTFGIYLRVKSTDDAVTRIGEAELPSSIVDFEGNPDTPEAQIILDTLNKFKEQIPEDATGIIAQELPNGQLNMIAECCL